MCSRQLQGICITLNIPLFNSGLEIKKPDLGCGFYVKGKLLKYVKNFKIIN